MESAEARLQNINNPLQDDNNASSNDRSLALRFSHGETTCILSGDISRRVEKSLLLKGENLQANILLSPHHGSNTSNSSPFLKEVNPQQIIVSAGRFHPDHFPSVQLRSYCKNNSIALLNTASHGAIIVKITNDSNTITSFRK
jgi:competence protein ComEC